MNLTQTATGGKPFASGTLAPRSGFRLTSGLIVSEEVVGAQRRLRSVDPATGQNGLLAGALRANATLGSGSAPNLLAPGVQGDSFLATTLTTLLRGPAGVYLQPDVAIGGGTTAFIAQLAAGPGAVVFALPGGGLFATPADAALREITSTPGGGLLVNGTALHYWAPGSAATLGTAGAAVRITLT